MNITFFNVMFIGFVLLKNNLLSNLDSSHFSVLMTLTSSNNLIQEHIKRIQYYKSLKSFYKNKIKRLLNTNT